MPLSSAQSRSLVQHFSDVTCDSTTVSPTKMSSSVILSKLSPRQPLPASSQSSDSVIVTSELFLNNTWCVAVAFENCGISVLVFAHAAVF